MSLPISDSRGGAQFAVKAVPGSSRSRVVGVHGDMLKVAVTAPPERGAANDAILELLALALAVPRARVTLVSGTSSPRKVVHVAGIAADEVRRRLSL